jgi:hypothetical protein
MTDYEFIEAREAVLQSITAIKTLAAYSEA